MRTGSVRLVCLVLPAFVQACSLFATSPATQSPLRERLQKSDTSRVEEAARACFAKSGWKVDPVGGLSNGANVVSASKAKDATNLYIQPPEVNPRVTGGPEYDDPFWSCLGGELSSSGAAPTASSPTSEDKP